jgi:membrane protease YdiL (CAAX protease family)
MNKSALHQLLISVAGIFLSTLAVNLFFKYFLFHFPLPVRALLMIAVYWLIGLVPLIMMRKSGLSLSALLTEGKNPTPQIIPGLLLGLAMSAAFTLIPHMLGLGDWVDNGHHYRKLWQFLFEFAYCIFAVGAVEELVFRGYLFIQLKELTKSHRKSVLISSALFGLFHFFAGNIVQMICTTLLGLFFCACRDKIKNCTLLYLIVAHGVYDALITVWASVL